MPGPIRVALLATSVEFGGIEQVVLNLLQHMDREIELYPIIFTRTDTGETSFFERLRALGTKHETFYVNSRGVAAQLANPIVNLAQLMSLFRKRRFDLIHSHGYRADMFALAVAKCFSLPVVATCHGFTPNDRRLRFYCAVDALVLRAFTRVIAVSAQMKADLIAGGIDATRVDVVTNAVASVSDDERELVRTQARRRLGIDHECFVFGYVGRLSDEKGVDYLLQALKAWPRPYDSMRLLVVGDGPRRQPLETLAHEWGLNEVVRFVGFQPDAAPWYSAMDAFVLPSLTEGTPMALLEAMAHGLPAIGTRVGGVPAVITDSVNGLLVPPADPAKLLKAMQVVTASAQLRDILSRGARESIRVTFNVVDWVHRVRAVYMKTLDGIR